MAELQTAVYGGSTYRVTAEEAALVREAEWYRQTASDIIVQLHNSSEEPSASRQRYAERQARSAMKEAQRALDRLSRLQGERDMKELNERIAASSR